MKHTLTGDQSFFSETATTAYYGTSETAIPANDVAVVINFAVETDVYIPDFPNVTVVTGDYTGERMPCLAEPVVTPITVNTFLSADIKDQVKLAELLAAKTIQIAINNFTRYVSYITKQQLFGDLLYVQDNKIYWSDGTTAFNDAQIFDNGTSYDIGLVFHPTKWFMTVNNIVIGIEENIPGVLAFPTTIGLSIGKSRDTIKNIIVQESDPNPLQIIAVGGEYIVSNDNDNVVSQ